MAQLVKNPPAMWETWFGKIPGGGHGNPLQCSGLENPMDSGAWRATVHGVAESDTTERLSAHSHFQASGLESSMHCIPSGSQRVRHD